MRTLASSAVNIPTRVRIVVTLPSTWLAGLPSFPGIVPNVLLHVLFAFPGIAKSIIKEPCCVNAAPKFLTVGSTVVVLLLAIASNGGRTAISTRSPVITITPTTSLGHSLSVVGTGCVVGSNARDTVSDSGALASTPTGFRPPRVFSSWIDRTSSMSPTLVRVTAVHTAS